MEMSILIALVAVACFAVGVLVGTLVSYRMTRKMELSARSDREALFNAELSAMKSQFESVSARLLKERSEEFKGENREHMETFTKPLLKELDNMREMLGRTKEGNDKNIAELNGAIKTMVEQSRKLGMNAENLADALKNRGKVQGDWGEVVLANILNDSGLRENMEYFVQKSYTDENGHELRPDVVVKCSDGSNVIVDSKVSLTAYTDYVSAENDDAREAACKENLASIVKHVDELAAKNYPKVVPHAVPYVLMFVPNEGSYILAVNKDPSIAQKAYRKGVLIINPTNLMLALNLILLTWQNTRQEENCVNIMKTAEGLYEKFCGFTDNFVKVGRQLGAVQNAYDDALGQLKDGKGNILSRFETMKQLGIASAKSVNEKLK